MRFGAVMAGVNRANCVPEFEIHQKTVINVPASQALVLSLSAEEISMSADSAFVSHRSMQLHPTLLGEPLPPVIGHKSTLFIRTRDEMPLTLAYAKRRGLNVVETVQPLSPKKSYVDIYPPDKAPLLADKDDISRRISLGNASGILPSVVEFAQHEEINIGNVGRANPLRKKNCDEEWICSPLSGDVTPCCQINEPVDPDWNITRHPLHEILQAEAYKNMGFNLWNGVFFE